MHDSPLHGTSRQLGAKQHGSQLHDCPHLGKNRQSAVFQFPLELCLTTDTLCVPDRQTRRFTSLGEAGQRVDSRHQLGAVRPEPPHGLEPKSGDRRRETLRIGSKRSETTHHGA